MTHDEKSHQVAQSPDPVLYHSPRLTTYGPFRALTAGGSQTANEGNLGTTLYKKKPAPGVAPGDISLGNDLNLAPSGDIQVVPGSADLPAPGGDAPLDSGGSDLSGPGGDVPLDSGGGVSSSSGGGQ